VATLIVSPVWCHGFPPAYGEVQGKYLAPASSWLIRAKARGLTLIRRLVEQRSSLVPGMPGSKPPRRASGAGSTAMRQLLPVCWRIGQPRSLLVASAGEGFYMIRSAPNRCDNARCRSLRAGGSPALGMWSSGGHRRTLWAALCRQARVPWSVAALASLYPVEAMMQAEPAGRRC